MQILLIEDSARDEGAVTRLLTSTADTEVRHCRDLDRALQILAEGGINAVLLDLSLPGGGGLAALASLRTAHERIPVVVLTGCDDEEVGVEAVKMGAQDHVCKDQLSGRTLFRALRYGIERQRVLSAMADLTRAEKRMRELYAIEQLSTGSSTEVTARTFHVTSLRESAPVRFEQFVAEYRSILGHAVEEQAFKVSYDTRERLKRLAGELGRHRSGPRDVVQIHLEALQPAVELAGPGRGPILVEEGRVLVLELMGDLAEFYRGYFFGR